TGLHYYGARYYANKASIWLSVDPLARKFPNVTPYNFSLNNPIGLVDPDGKQPWPIFKKFGLAIRVIVSGLFRNSNNAYHGGVDIAHLGNSGQVEGAPIVATHDGTVTVS